MARAGSGMQCRCRQAPGLSCTFTDGLESVAITCSEMVELERSGPGGEDKQSRLFSVQFSFFLGADKGREHGFASA